MRPDVAGDSRRSVSTSREALQATISHPPMSDHPPLHHPNPRPTLAHQGHQAPTILGAAATTLAPHHSTGEQGRTFLLNNGEDIFIDHRQGGGSLIVYVQ